MRKHLSLRSLVVPVLIATISSFMPKVGHTEVRPKTVTVCSLAAPEQFDGVLISVTGQYRSDGIEHEGLFDSSCKDIGIALIIPSSAKGKKQLQDALRGGSPGTLDKTIVGTFVGVFHWNANGHPPRSLSVSTMGPFKVQHH